MSTITITTVVIPNYQRGGATAELRIAANGGFRASSGSSILPGNTSTGPFYKLISCTVSGTDLTIPQFTIDSTTDASDPNATYHAMFYDSTGKKAGSYWSNYRIPTSLGSTISHTQLNTFNSTVQSIVQYSYPNVDQVQDLIDASVTAAGITAEEVIAYAIAL